MALLEIRLYGDQVLRERSVEVDEITKEDRRLVEDMIETMYDEPGVGLAAPQVGVNKRIIVVDPLPESEETEAMALVNPELYDHSERTVVMEEGCLSIPEFRGDVKRPRFVKLRARDLDGNDIEIEADELLSRILQHEVDHLDGVLFVDRLTPLRRDLAKRKLRKRLMRGELAVSARE